MEEREEHFHERDFAWLFVFLLFSGCWNNASTYDINEIAIVEEITLPEQTSEDLNFKSSYRVKGIDVKVRWIPRDQAVIDAKGSVTKGLTPREVDIEIEVIIDDDRVTRYLGTVQVLPLSDEELLDVLKQLLDVPEEAEDYINFPTQCEIAGVAATLSWHSGNTDAITDNGIVKFAENDQYVNFELDVITASGALGDIKVPGGSLLLIKSPYLKAPTPISGCRFHYMTSISIGLRQTRAFWALISPTERPCGNSTKPIKQWC